MSENVVSIHLIELSSVSMKDPQMIPISVVIYIQWPLITLRSQIHIIIVYEIFNDINILNFVFMILD